MKQLLHIHFSLMAIQMYLLDVYDIKYLIKPPVTKIWSFIQIAATAPAEYRNDVVGATVNKIQNKIVSCIPEISLVKVLSMPWRLLRRPN